MRRQGRQGDRDSHVVPARLHRTCRRRRAGACSTRLPQPSSQGDATPDSPTDDATLDWQQHLNLAIDDLNARVADGPRSTAEVHQFVSLRLLELLAGDTEAALKPIPNVSTEEQDYWSGQIFALATFLDHHRQPDDKRRAAASVVHLDEAVGHLRELGTLSLRNLAFCKNVYGYGAYEPINNPTFSAGQQVTLYLEVENYHSESTQKGYTTQARRELRSGRRGGRAGRRRRISQRRRLPARAAAATSTFSTASCCRRPPRRANTISSS